MSESLVAARRILLLPAALVGLCLAYLMLSAMSGYLFQLCGDEFITTVSDDEICIAPWYDRASYGASMASLMLGATLFTTLPALIEPRRRYDVAVFFFVVGACVMGLVGVVIASYPSLLALPLSAIASGLLCVYLIKKRFKAGNALPMSWWLSWWLTERWRIDR